MAAADQQTHSVLLGSIQRVHVLDALARLDAGEPTLFSESTKYDLVYEGRRYPPKRVAGLALHVLTGSKYAPAAFKGGLESTCFRVLQKAGFTIAPKDVGGAPGDVTDSVKEVLYLQTKYSSSNTPDMKRRGWLIRTEIPRQIRLELPRFEPLFSARGYSFSVEGSDGIGRKVESTWVRLHDPEMSPSATAGWYVVVHFDRRGERVFITLGCGATRFEGGSFIGLPTKDLDTRVAWARELPPTDGFNPALFTDGISLNGNDLSALFERATAYSRAIPAAALTASGFYSALEALAKRLMDVYDAQRAGQDPAEPAHDLDAAISALNVVVSPRSRAMGQGRGLTAAERAAVEQQAMLVAEQGLVAAGFTNIENVSKNSSYDFKAEKDGSQWMVEVKGTSSAGCDQFLLTWRELELHQKYKGKTALALVSGIRLERDPTLSAAGGVLELLAPWDPESWDFQPTTYRAVRTGALTK